MTCRALFLLIACLTVASAAVSHGAEPGKEVPWWRKLPLIGHLSSDDNETKKT